MTERLKTVWLMVAIATGLAAITAFLVASERADAAVLEGPCVSLCEPPTKVEPPGPHSMLVLNLGWNTGMPTGSSPLVESNLAYFVNYLSGHVNDWFRKSAPGFVQDWEVTPGGSYVIEPPQSAATHCSSREPFLTDLIERGDAAARARGIDPSSYGVVVYEWDASICNFSGLTNAAGGKHIALQAKPYSAEHELGHHLGLVHANSIKCDANGNWVPLSNSCTLEDYGDPYDTMGRGKGLFNAAYQNALGWLGNQTVKVNAGDFTQSWTLKPLSDPSQSPRALRLVDGSTTLWLEYRQPTGLEAPAVTGETLAFGLLVHREVPPPQSDAGAKPMTELLDMSPYTTFADSALPVGQTWVNPLGTMKITLSSSSASGATVTVSSQRISVPNLEGATLAGAKSMIQAANLTFGGSTLLKDPSCTLIGKVMEQTPTANSRVLPGSSVRVTIGQKDTKHECF